MNFGRRSSMTASCTTNEDCRAFDGAFCAMTTTKCGEPLQGRCLLMTGDYQPQKPVSIPKLGTLTASSGKMTWWSAHNWCAAQGQSLIDVEDFGCYRSSSNPPDLIEKDEEDGHCCAPGLACGYWASLWKNNRWFNVEVKRYSPTIVSLRQAYDQNWFWTRSGAKNDSCKAFYVDLFVGYMNHNSRDFLYRALCRS